MKVDFSLYLVTDRKITKGLSGAIEEALQGGVRCVQLREKDLSGRELLMLARGLREITKNHGARLLINDRIDVAIASEADGVHLGQSSVSPRDARSLLGKDKLIGASAHSLAEAKRAHDEGADFITLGPVYYTASKAAYGAPFGPAIINEVKKAVGVPVYAIGGINVDRIPEVISWGADGVALISAILGSKDIKKSAAEFTKALRLEKNKR